MIRFKHKELTIFLWTLFLIFESGVTHEKGIESNSTTSGESPETIQSLNSWVQIPDWKNSNPEYWKEDVVGDEDEDDIFPVHNSAEFHSPYSGSGGHRAFPPPSETRRGGGGGLSEYDEENHDGPEPFFDHQMVTNVSEQLGNHAFLRCRVKNLGDRTLSWIKMDNLHIITSGRIQYSNDDRFQIMHNEGSDEWTLVIKYVQTRDSGQYSCDVNGKTTISHFFNLQVLVPKAIILGAKEYHLQPGTLLTLVCIVENAIRSPPQYLYWYHNSEMINFGTISGVSVHTEPGVHTHSRLTIPSAGHQHAGNYTCGSVNTQPAHIQVFVSEGDKTASITVQGTGLSNYSPPGWTLFGLLYLFQFLYSLLLLQTQR